MSFAAPLFLLGLLLVPLAAWRYVRRERRGSGVAPAALMPSLVPRRAGWRRHAPIGLYGIALATLLVAVARPQATVAVPVEEATVIVVTDRSGSMLATDVAPSRLEAARKAAGTFLDAVPRDVRVGAIAFNHVPQVLQAPTRDHEAVRATLATIGAAGSTATGDALDMALRLVRSVPKRNGKVPPAAIVLLSDGKSVRGRDALAVAVEAKQAKVPVYTVALGTAGGTIERPSPSGGVRQVPVPPDPDTLRRIAQETGGRSFAADDAAGLQSVYGRLAREVATEKRKQDVSASFAGGALFLLAAAALLSLRWFGRFV